MGRLEGNVQPAHPFNSTLETGIRALVVLEAFYPRRCDLLEMTWLDHLVVHTGADSPWRLVGIAPISARRMASFARR